MWDETAKQELGSVLQTEEEKDEIVTKLCNIRVLQGRVEHLLPDVYGTRNFVTKVSLFALLVNSSLLS